jgi:Sulfatase
MPTQRNLTAAGLLAAGAVILWLATSAGRPGQVRAQESHQKSSQVLPVPDAPFRGVIGETAKESKPDFPKQVTAPPGAPNVLLIMTDDTGFGATSTFGGPIPTPALDRVARHGVIYNQFHTTALCSPTRAALLTGRNHHSAGFGNITEFASGYPGYDSILPKSVGTIGNILADNGYNTAWFGKHHLVPEWLQGPPGRSISGPAAWASSTSTDSWAATRTSGIRRCSKTTKRCFRHSTTQITS